MKPEKKKELKNIVEAALLAAGRPLNLDEILALFTDEERPERAEVKKALEALDEDFKDRGIEIKEVASGFRIQVRQALGPWISRLWEERPARYSRALLETMALVAYRQPITRGEIEDVRGVSVSTHIIRTLQERGWIRIVGHRDVPGHPEMFGTTKEFLDYFSLKSLDELPTLAQLRDIESINAELDLGLDVIPAQAVPVAVPRLADDEADAMDEGESGVITH
jgi:segregation and condensation protein B